MLAPLRIHIRTQRHDLHLLATGVINKPFHQCLANPHTTHAVRHTCVIGNDQVFVDNGKGQFGRLGDPAYLRQIAAFVAILFQGDVGGSCLYHCRSPEVDESNCSDPVFNLPVRFQGSTWMGGTIPPQFVSGCQVEQQEFGILTGCQRDCACLKQAETVACGKRLVVDADLAFHQLQPDLPAGRMSKARLRSTDRSDA